MDVSPATEYSRLRAGRVIIVGCGQSKASEARRARDLYTGSLTRVAALHATLSGDPWYFASALHFLVHPDQVLAPYEHSLTSVKPEQRSIWALTTLQMVHAEASRRGRPWPAVVEIHAGGVYATSLAEACRRFPGNLVAELPLEGLQVGERRHWYALRRPGLEDRCIRAA